ncbi:MAG: SseB family protein [Actinomycetes bacterium]
MSSDFSGAEIPEPDFKDDDGSPDPRLRSVLRNYAESATAQSARNLLDALMDARLLIPVVAELDEIEDGVEKDSHMASVEFHATDGRRALLAFSGTDSMLQWDPNARPVARVGYAVAQTTLEQELDALIVDVSGPVPTAIDGTLLALLAIGPNREALLDQTLDEVVAKLAELPGINSAHWDDTDEDVTITLSITEPIGSLGAAITEVIQGSDLNALLDRPLEVQISS